MTTLDWLEYEEGALCDHQTSYLELLTIGIELLLTWENGCALIRPHVVCQVVDLPQVKSPNIPQLIILHHVDLLDELRDHLHECVYLVANLPLARAYDIPEQVSPVGQGDHLVAKLRVTNH